MKYFAHSLEGKGVSDWEPLEDHLQAVEDRAASFAEVIGASEWGRLLGRWHDLGKYSKEFQAYLLRENGFEAHLEQFEGRVDHATAGAQHSVNVFGPKHPIGLLLAYCIAGHHAGLADATSQSGTSGLQQRLKKKIPDFSAAPSALLVKPELSPPSLYGKHGCAMRFSFQMSLFTRMLFSCLVDADFLATEAFMSPDRTEVRPIDLPSMATLRDLLDNHLEVLATGKSGQVASARQEVLSACRSTAREKRGLYSLTVPTGGGKTLSSLAFALEHAKTHGMARVIYAIPFTSIIDQTADVFRRIFSECPDGTIVEHHSNLDPDRETPRSRLAAENWDVPLIVTTNVQLFESLFAAKTSRCRKLHNICNSVIVLDEVQTIPVTLLEPTLAAIRELTIDFGCTVVLCTATQPAFLKSDEFSIGLENVREITPDPTRLYKSLKRVTIQNRGTLSDEALVQQLSEHSQFLCIVNTRPHAARIFSRLTRLEEEASLSSSTSSSSRYKENQLFHLSTFMCSQHRADVLTRIRQRLTDKLPCQVISTQLIEAGVDVDFPVVFRSTSGIDSIAQAAGRCNREGRRDTGNVIVFDPTNVQLRGYLKSVADSGAELIAELNPDDMDLLGQETVRRYFQIHFWKHKEQWDEKKVMECFPPPSPTTPVFYNFKTAACRFQWIEDKTETVFVPYEKHGQKLIERLRREGPSRDLLRRLQRYSVGVYDRVFNAMIGTDIERLDSGYAILINESCYDPDLGFRSDQSGFHDPESLIV
jgi:CRISPR-associated endonuclease/helicase Cas3